MELLQSQYCTIEGSLSAASDSGKIHFRAVDRNIRGPYVIFLYPCRHRPGTPLNALFELMRWLRSTWRLRLLVGLLAVSLLPFMGVLPEQQTWTASQSQASWLRAQVDTTPDREVQEAFDRAIEAATSSEARSLHAFLQVFADAYVEQAPGQSLSDLFDAPDLGGERLIRYLKQRFTHVSTLALVPRLLFSAQAASSLSSDRLMAVGTTALPPASSLVAAAWTAVRGDVWIGSVPVRVLFPAQPMGP